MHLLHLYQFQAYAESETDTPGQTFGVTYKTDGKSSSWTSSSSSTSSTRQSTAEKISEEFTQGPKHEEHEIHDENGSNDPERKRHQNEILFKMVGAAIVIVIICYMLKKSEERVMTERRDRTLAEQRVRNDRAKDFSDA